MITDTKITVMDRSQTLKYTKNNPMDETTALISIATPNTEYNDWPLVNKAKNVLFVEFYDNIVDDGSDNVISDKTADLIAEVVREWLNTGIRHILIHCDTGTSRSTGVATAIANAYHIPEQNITYMARNKSCNPTVYDKILDRLAPNMTASFSDTVLKNLTTIRNHAMLLPKLNPAEVFTEDRANAIRTACDNKNLAELKDLIGPMMWTVERDRVDTAAKMRCYLINRAINDCFREVMSEVYEAICWLGIDHPETKLTSKLDTIMQAMVFENVDIVALRKRLLDLTNMVFDADRPGEAQDIVRDLRKTADMLNILIK